jgi:protein TonB
MNILENNAATINEIVFENRNKSYGAYVIRGTYSNTIAKSLGITCMFFLCISFIALELSNREEVDKKMEIGTNIIPDIYTAVEITPVEKPQAALPKQRVVSPLQTTAVSTHFTDHPDEQKKEPVQITNALPAEGTGPAANVTDPALGNSGGTETYGAGTGTEPGITSSTGIERVPDVMPSFKNLPAFLQKNLRFPERARNEGVSGSVYVYFVIDEEGNVISTSVLHGAGYGFDEEALRVIKLMPKWTPAMKNGKPVKTSFTQAITFRLQ